MAVQEGFVGGTGSGSGGVSPERGNGQQGAVRDEFCFVLSVADGEVEVCF